MTHEHWLCNAVKGSIGCWINKAIFAICPNILVIISVLCMHYKVSKDGLLFEVYSTFKLSKHSKVRIPVLFLTMHLTLACWKYFEHSWKSGPAKTDPAGLVPPPLVCPHKTITINTYVSISRQKYNVSNLFLNAM